MKNLFTPIATNLPQEVTEILAESNFVRIEKIVSHGHASPAGFWYDQEENEWVVVLQGRAKLRMEGEQESLEMGPGDCINIPAHRRHRVESTSERESTVWLAVFYKD